MFLSHRWSFDKGVRGDGGTGGQNPTIGAPREGNIRNIYKRMEFERSLIEIVLVSSLCWLSKM